ncbi:Alpha-ketoglutarate-dependent dioxygenase AlkB [Serratia rubidaea]|uniref:Alpha-ketoglutarate-dependent dioxygenase AlkB n=1 Tax=Serratia rubidaea TaxID=61652 RepID=A0A447QED0_SERRU|nr:Alpha-ketoglutarate-dependent dioxygenase AlkB [Serratia rubidaea]
MADEAALQAGFGHFTPDSCLINRYDPGSKLSLHQDKDERDFGAPIVSVSLGLPAVFQFGGLQRSDRARRIPLAHGDVVVWGGPSRLCFHGILPVKEGYHSLVGRSASISLCARRCKPRLLRQAGDQMVDKHPQPGGRCGVGAYSSHSPPR